MACRSAGALSPLRGSRFKPLFSGGLRLPAGRQGQMPAGRGFLGNSGDNGDEAIDKCHNLMKPKSGKPVIGLVGGVAAGKSTVAAALRELCCVVIDADAIGHELLGEEAIRGELRGVFGDDIFSADGCVDRKALGDIVFADPGALARLNGILHPPVRAEVLRRLNRAQSHRDTPAIVLDAALLLEAGWDDLCSQLIFVEAPSTIRCSRAMKERGWDEATWKAREKSQISLDKKAARCDHIVDSSSSASYLHEQIRELFHRIVPAADYP